MIKSFRNSWLQDFFTGDVYHKKIPASIRNQLFRKIQILDDATCDMDLRSLPSNRFKNLSGSLKDRYSIRVNKKWRLIFSWNIGESHEKNRDKCFLICNDRLG